MNIILIVMVVQPPENIKNYIKNKYIILVYIQNIKYRNMIAYVQVIVYI